MVKIYLYLLLLVIPLFAMEELQTNCRKKEIYSGETIICDFEIISNSNMLDIEVVKFPEFRGYWSENLALKQGPIFLDSFTQNGMRRATIGSYAVSPMLGKKNPLILGMKVQVKFPGQSGMLLESLSPDIKILDLPHLPDSVEKKSFIGGVGKFNLQVDSLEVSFQKDEPTSFIVRISGDGNFPDISGLPIYFPDSVEVTSKKTTTVGTKGFSTKTFDYRLLVKSKNDFYIPPHTFYTFDPQQKKYEPLELPQVKFKFTEKKIEENVAKDPIELLPPFSDTSLKNRLWQNQWFWAVQLGVLLVFGYSLISQRLKLKQQTKLLSPLFQRQLKWKKLQELSQAKDQDSFLGLAWELCRDRILEVTRGKHSDSISSLVNQKKDSFSGELTQDFKVVETSYNNAFYSKEKRSIQGQYEDLLQRIKRILFDKWS